MMGTWRDPNGNDEWVKARQVQVELAESAAVLMSVAGRLSQLVADLNEVDEVEKGSHDD